MRVVKYSCSSSRENTHTQKSFLRKRRREFCFFHIFFLLQSLEKKGARPKNHHYFARFVWTVYTEGKHTLCVIIVMPFSPRKASSFTSRFHATTSRKNPTYYHEEEDKRRRNDENEDANKREIPNESTRLFSVESDLKLAKMTRAQGSWSPLRAFLSILSIAVVAMICIYVGYAEDVYDSEKVLSTEAKEAAEALYTREKFLFFGKEDGRLGNRNFQRWELPKKLW